MSEQAPRPTHAPDTSITDADVNASWIVRFGIWLAVITAGSMFLMSLLFRGFAKMDQAREPARPPLYEEMAGRVKQGPPGAQLQASPPEDMTVELQEENERLSTYGWVDEQKGIARIPIERAIDLLAAQGLPSRPAASPPEARR